MTSPVEFLISVCMVEFILIIVLLFRNHAKNNKLQYTIPKLNDAWADDDWEEVVRCKDCIHYMPSPFDRNRHCCGLFIAYLAENDFCSHGERKTK